MKNEIAQFSVGVTVFLGGVSCGGEGQMQEPDRTITIVSIIGLIIIWGSFLYHKFLQGGGGEKSAGDAQPSVEEEVGAGSTPEESESSQRTKPPVGNKGNTAKKKSGKRR